MLAAAQGMLVLLPLIVGGNLSNWLIGEGTVSLTGNTYRHIAVRKSKSALTFLGALWEGTLLLVYAIPL
jgi:hypothetical protein